MPLINHTERRLPAKKVAELDQVERTLCEQFLSTNQELDESEQQSDMFRDLFDEAPIGYVLQAIDSRFIRANRAAMKILGVKPNEITEVLGTSFSLMLQRLNGVSEVCSSRGHAGAR